MRKCLQEFATVFFQKRFYFEQKSHNLNFSFKTLLNKTKKMIA